MARRGVAYSEVAETAMQLAQAGQLPTVDRVRAVLGTGSKSTIAPLLKRWKSQQAETVSEAQTGLPRELVAAVKALHENMQQQARVHLEATQEKARLEIEEARQVQREAEAHQKGAEAALGQQQQAYAQLETEHTALKVSWDELQRAYPLLQARAEGLQQRLNDQAQLVQDLKHHLTQAQDNLEHYRESVRQQRAEERAGWERQLCYGEQTLKEVREESQTLRAVNARLDKEVLELCSERERLQTERTTLTHKVEQLDQELSSTRQQWAEREGHYQALTHSHQESMAKIQEQEREIRKGEKAAAVAQEKIKTLAAALHQIEERFTQLQSENQTLAQEKAYLEGQIKQWQRA